MLSLLENIERIENASFIKTNKYKDINCYMCFVMPYSKKRYAAYKCLSNLMLETTQKYNTKKKMTDIKDMLYGINASSDVFRYQGCLAFTVAFSFVNPKFLNDIKEKDFIDFMNEIINHPLFIDKELQESKRLLKDHIKRRLENPSSLCVENFIKLLSNKDDCFDIYLNDITKEINELTLKDITDEYDKLFTSTIYTYCIGDYSEELKEYICSFKSNNKIIAHNKLANINGIKDIEISKNTNQSTLIVSYLSPILRYSDNYYGMMIANALLGAQPTSLLFKSVREKYSLCYSIYSFIFKSEGLTFIVTEIDKKNYQKTIKEINRQIKLAKLGLFSKQRLEMTKLQALNDLKSMNDDNDSFVMFDLMFKVYDKNITLSEHMNSIMNVTKKDVVQAFKSLKKCFTYYLKGINNE